MRRLPSIAAALLALALPVAPAVAQTTGGAIAVPIDQSVRVSFGGPARDLVIGNPMIADVTMLASSDAVILGKEYGVTTITAFDAYGRPVFSRRVVVMGSDDNKVSYLRGAETLNYACGPRCERTPMPGETQRTYNEAAGPFTAYADRQKPKQDSE